MKIDGKPVIDAKKSLVLTITPEDVRRGSKRKPDSCAAALACMRQFHSAKARVNLGRVYVDLGTKWVRYLTPPSLRTEIVSFDRGFTFAAGDYKLRKIAPTLRLGTPRKERVTDNKTRSDKGTTRPVKKGARLKSHIPAGVRGRAHGWTTKGRAAA